jgi:hypothetical protein
MAANPTDNIPMIANANRCSRNVGRIVAIETSRSSATVCSVKLFSRQPFDFTWDNVSTTRLGVFDLGQSHVRSQSDRLPFADAPASCCRPAGRIRRGENVANLPVMRPWLGKTVVIPEARSLHLDHRLHDEPARPRVGNAERAQRSQC